MELELSGKGQRDLTTCQRQLTLRSRLTPLEVFVRCGELNPGDVEHDVADERRSATEESNEWASLTEESREDFLLGKEVSKFRSC